MGCGERPRPIFFGRCTSASASTAVSVVEERAVVAAAAPAAAEQKQENDQAAVVAASAAVAIQQGCPVVSSAEAVEQKNDPDQRTGIDALTSTVCCC